MYLSGRQSIVSTFSQESIIPALIIIIVAVLFYYDGLQVYIHGEICWNLYAMETYRSNFYLSGIYTLPRPVEYAIEDLIRFVFGLDNPLPFHALALGLHATNSIIVFLILKKVMDSLIGLSSALLFTSFFAHPDVVIYHYGMGEVLMTIFSLLCIILFYRYRENPTKTNYALTLGAFILAIGTKESASITLPLMMYLVDRYIQIESETRGVKLSKSTHIPFIMISIAWLTVVFVIWGQTESSIAFLEVHLFDQARWPINLYNGTVASFNFCLFKGPGLGTLFLILSLMLSCLPLFDRRTKRCLILLWVGWLIAIIPIMGIGMNPRYLYIPSAFSMTIFATCVYHLIAYVVRRFKLKEDYITFLTILFISVPMTTSFLYVSRHLRYLKDTGRVCESLHKLILADLPTGALRCKLVLINFPHTYEPSQDSGHIITRHILWWWWGPEPSIFALVYKRNVEATYFTLPELYNGRHRLMPVSKLSPQEFEKLAVEKDTKVYLFNPRNDTILNVTGKDYESLKELISN